MPIPKFGNGLPHTIHCTTHAWGPPDCSRALREQVSYSGRCVRRTTDGAEIEIEWRAIMGGCGPPNCVSLSIYTVSHEVALNKVEMEHSHILYRRTQQKKIKLTLGEVFG